MNQPSAPRSRGGLITGLIALIIILAAALAWYVYNRPAYPSESNTYSGIENSSTAGDTTAHIQNSLEQEPDDSASLESLNALDADVSGF